MTVKKFLAPNPSDRLRKKDAIAKLKFFKAIDWKRLAKGELQAPHTPFVNFPEDTSNFDDYPEDSKDIMPTTTEAEQGGIRREKNDKDDPFAAFDDDDDDE